MEKHKILTNLTSSESTEKTLENLLFPYHACYQYQLQHATIIVALAPQPILQGDVYKGQALLRTYRGQCLLTVGEGFTNQNHLQTTQKRDSIWIPIPPAHVQGSARRACGGKQEHSNQCYKANYKFQFTSTLLVIHTTLKDFWMIFSDS